MKLVLTSTSRTVIESAQMALEAAGIYSVVSDNPAFPAGPAAILVDTPDYDEAINVVRQLEVSTTDASRRRWPRSPALLIIGLLALLAILMLVAAFMGDRYEFW